jgi:tRNA threonylcarbamoyl adenosine modification protein (Sua5/YciO/YrdC/YwlC family)
MPAEVIKFGSGPAIQSLVPRVIEMLKKGGLVILPTETVYGLAGDGYSQDVFMKISLLKKRPSGKALPIQVDKAERVFYLARNINLIGLLLMRRLWPGPLTIIFEGAKDLPFFLKSNDGKIGIRVPDYEPLRLVLAGFGRPLFVTSANKSGENSPNSVEEIKEEIKKSVDLIVDGGRTALARESTIVDITMAAPAILRKGILGKDKLQEALSLKKIIFVCTGNSCRSVMARYYLEKMFKAEGINGLSLDSAGIGAVTGLGASFLSLEVLRAEGIDACSHRTKPLTRELVEESDLIVAMGEIHRHFICENFPESKYKVRLLSDFFRDKGWSNEIGDPMGQGKDVYLTTLFQIKNGLEGLVREIRQLRIAFQEQG